MKTSDMRFIPILVAILFLEVFIFLNYVNTTNGSHPISTLKIKIPTVSGGEAAIFLPAVDDKGNGALSMLDVQVMSGSGKTLTNIDHILFFVDTQYSIQTAKFVAANLTGVDISKYNLIYDIGLNENKSSGLIEGPSAGAALAIATVAALENKTLNPEVMITGTINPDGSIGKVGSVPEKAKVAQEAGARIFLVPIGQGIVQQFEPATQCEQIKSFKVCRTEYKEVKSLKLDENGLVVKEVANIQDALKYFLPQ